MSKQEPVQQNNQAQEELVNDNIAINQSKRVSGEKKAQGVMVST